MRSGSRPAGQRRPGKRDLAETRARLLTAAQWLVWAAGSLVAEPAERDPPAPARRAMARAVGRAVVWVPATKRTDGPLLTAAGRAGEVQAGDASSRWPG